VLRGLGDATRPVVVPVAINAGGHPKPEVSVSTDAWVSR
jgi:hypothetical protein